MFARKVSIERIASDGSVSRCPIAWIDNFAMRNFTNDAIFDDTLPIADGVMEIGNRVSVEELKKSMQEWFRRKGYIRADDSLLVNEI